MESLNSICRALNGVVRAAHAGSLPRRWTLPSVRLETEADPQIGAGFSLLLKVRERQGEGQISPFNALMTSQAATTGTDNTPA